MLTTSKLTFSYPNGQSFSFPDLRCEDGAHWLILGQSGGGKTTFLHLLGGLLKPKAGNIIIGNQDIANFEGSTLDQFRGQHIGIVFQQSHLVKAVTVEENLLLAQYLSGKAKDRERAKNLLTTLNLGDKLKAYPSDLSLGEQQRVAIARALINRPSLILADEPTSSLDDVNCEEVIQLLLKQSADNQATLIIVTHDARLKERVANQVILEGAKLKMS